MSTYAVVDPATGQTVQSYPAATDAQVEEALAAATKAHKEWSKATTVADRAALVKKVAALHAERREKLAAIIQREMGKPVDQALGEVDFCVAIYEFYADNAEKFLADEPIELLAGEGTAVIRRTSVGVILGIMWVLKTDGVREATRLRDLVSDLSVLSGPLPSLARYRFDSSLF